MKMKIEIDINEAYPELAVRINAPVMTQDVEN